MALVTLRNFTLIRSWDMIKKYCADYEHDKVVTVRGVDVSKNSGKGNAARMGCLYSKGDNILIIDADGATSISDYERLQDNVVFLKVLVGQNIKERGRRNSDWVKKT